MHRVWSSLEHLPISVADLSYHDQLTSLIEPALQIMSLPKCILLMHHCPMIPPLRHADFSRLRAEAPTRLRPSAAARPARPRDRHRRTSGLSATAAAALAARAVRGRAGAEAAVRPEVKGDEMQLVAVREAVAGEAERQRWDRYVDVEFMRNFD